jgi:PAS domain S-box-containing protein
VFTGEPRITPDVLEDPLWQPWSWLAERFDYRACWSFPVKTSGGKALGTFAMYFRLPRAATARDVQFANVLTNSAAIIISKHQEAEERAQIERARLRLAAIVESSNDAIVSKDLDGTVTSWNQQAEQLFGYSQEEMVGRSILTIVPPELHTDERVILDMIGRGQGIQHLETVRIAKSGERIDVSLSISPVRDENGKIVGAAKIARDIRESKRIERALRTTEKLAAAGRLAATVAHEINNPLEAVTNLLFLAERNVATDADRVAAYLSTARGELDRVAHITRQTLAFYRDNTAPVCINMAKTIDDLLVLYQNRLHSRAIEVLKEYGNDVEVTVFAGEMQQAISNLLTNAIDAMNTGGRLRLRIRKSHFKGSSRIPGLRLTVADSGCGIESADRKSIFEPFFTTKKDVGTGLGLWITRGIVEKHKGSIRLKSSAGAERHGTVFSIFIPADMGGMAARVPGQAPPVDEHSIV